MRAVVALERNDTAPDHSAKWRRTDYGAVGCKQLRRHVDSSALTLRLSPMGPLTSNCSKFVPNWAVVNGGVAGELLGEQAGAWVLRAITQSLYAETREGTAMWTSRRRASYAYRGPDLPMCGIVSRAAAFCLLFHMHAEELTEPAISALGARFPQRGGGQPGAGGGRLRRAGCHSAAPPLPARLGRASSKQHCRPQMNESMILAQSAASIQGTSRAAVQQPPGMARPAACLVSLRQGDRNEIDWEPKC
jgi:hypothetical protein